MCHFLSLDGQDGAVLRGWLAHQRTSPFSSLFHHASVLSHYQLRGKVEKLRLVECNGRYKHKNKQTKTTKTGQEEFSGPLSALEVRGELVSLTPGSYC